MLRVVADRELGAGLQAVIDDLAQQALGLGRTATCEQVLAECFTEGFGHLVAPDARKAISQRMPMPVQKTGMANAGLNEAQFALAGRQTQSCMGDAASARLAPRAM